MKFIDSLNVPKNKLFFSLERLWEIWALHLTHVDIDSLLQLFDILLLCLHQLIHDESGYKEKREGGAGTVREKRERERERENGC